VLQPALEIVVTTSSIRSRILKVDVSEVPASQAMSHNIVDPFEDTERLSRTSSSGQSTSVTTSSIRSRILKDYEVHAVFVGAFGHNIVDPFEDTER